MPRDPEAIEWSILEGNYISPGLPIEQPMVMDPDLRLVFAPAPPRLGLRLRIPEGQVLSNAPALSNVTFRTVHLAGKRYVEVVTSSPDLFRAIYALTNDVMARISDGQHDALLALESSLSAFQQLVAQARQISKEKAIGLFGEIVVLERLLASGAPDAACWIGQDRECHDFRLGLHELEVKTTTANVREHQIHGLNQMTPTPGHSLSLVSVRLGNPGSGPGRSLNDVVDAVRAMLPGHPSRASFERALAEAGYDTSHAECAVRYQLNADITEVFIEEDFPLISHEWLQDVLGSHSTRIRNVSLTLNLEGLGRPFDAAVYVTEGQ